MMNNSQSRFVDVTDRIIEALQLRIQEADRAGEDVAVSFQGPGDHHIHDTGLGIAGSESATTVRYVSSFDLDNGQSVEVADRHLSPEQVAFYVQQNSAQTQDAVSHLQGTARSMPSDEEEMDPPAPSSGPSM
ncbi:hypothetical protein EZI54_07170 [Marinobacter halodurans]|uniref:Uncharacterized protein n=1 Tax=Marinobacter halodurans TaxID=2528979 RepID=A0ABY1ZPX1_9GAMM|nr:hypothetical protein [Marinobacter halodurans]TBW57432.1 hypothetical protein EZI54_07170 [Marinobacter halodurans]